MKRTVKIVILLGWLGAFAWVVLAWLPPAGARDLPLDKIQLPPGFKIEVYTDKVPGARSLAVSPKQTVFVGTRTDGKVYAVPDSNRDGGADTVHTIASGLIQPNGVAFRDGNLYVAEISRIWRFADIEAQLARPPKPKLIKGDLPKEAHHGWKFIRFGPDGKLYVPIGAPCNICERPSPFAAISRMRPNGKDWEVFATGVRNTVGFDWNPQTGVLWFTDNGRDWLGDDLPPDELNRAPRAGMNFGFPYCYGAGIPDPKYQKPANFCRGKSPPALSLPAHVAPLGMRFYTGKMFPKKYHNAIFLAEHGSWNRAKKIGYRVVVIFHEGGKVTGKEIFAQGWLQGESVWGRPVDVAVMADGALLVSDDRAGVLYRISYASKP